MKNVFCRWGHLMAAFALMVTTMASNQCCVLVYHQEEMPEGSKSLRKF